MSAMPARITELSQAPVAGAPAASVPIARSERRTERRAVLKLERRSRQRWSIFSCAVLVGVFALTVGVLDVLH
ncbi:MAG TPA: hypothetical protein VGL48_14750 [Acidimicrobiales bacterium]|jgi:hypothetical protein